MLFVFLYGFRFLSGPPAFTVKNFLYFSSGKSASKKFPQYLFMRKYLYFIFIFERYLCWIQDSWLTVFFSLSTLNILFYVFLGIIVSGDKSPILSLLRFPCDNSFFACCFQNFSVFGFQYFHYDESVCGSLSFILLGVPWTSWLCRLLFNIWEDFRHDFFNCKMFVLIF